MCMRACILSWPRTICYNLTSRMLQPRLVGSRTLAASFYIRSVKIEIEKYKEQLEARFSNIYRCLLLGVLAWMMHLLYHACIHAKNNITPLGAGPCGQECWRHSIVEEAWWSSRSAAPPAGV